MKKDKTLTLVPKLRFPKFREAGAWEEKTIGHFLAESRVPSLESNPAKRITVKLNLQGIEHREFRGTEAANSTWHFIRRAGQFIYGKQNIHKGAFGLIPDNLDGFETSQDLPAFNFLANSDPHWFVYYLSRENIYSSFELMMSGTGSKRLNESIFLKEKIISPSLPEQQKIAECLTSLDELIAAESQQLDALKAHKKGLMQQLFPREGETTPQLRFPEFQDAGEWEEKKLETLARRGSGHTPSKSKKNYYDGGIKWVSLADSKRLDKGFISETEIEISEEGIKNSSANLHPEGSVLLCRDAGIGRSAIMKVPMAVSQHFIVWTCDNNILLNLFLYYVMQVSKPKFERSASGSTIKTIGLQFFRDLNVTIPPPPEQQRIADCLSSFDDLISAQAEKIETLRTHKKGLMQQLFPHFN